MTRLPELLNKTKEAAYLEWVVFAQTAIRVLIFLAFAASFFALTDFIQAIEYGVLAWSVALTFIIWVLYRAFERYKDIRPMDYGTRRFSRIRTLALLSTACVPVATSWLENQSLYGAINPPGYWREELADSAASKCSLYQDILARSAENFRVVQNKYNMGIATAFEVKESAEVLKSASGMHRDCVTSAENRRTRATIRLNELLGKK